MSSYTALYDSLRARLHAGTDRLLAVLAIAQWLAAVALALALPPGGDGRVIAALAAGPILGALPFALLQRRPDWPGTRHALAVSQALWSALLVTLAGDHAPMYLHAAGSLAVLSLYRDWKVLATACAVLLANSAASFAVAGAAHGVHPAELALWLSALGAALGYSCARGEDELRLSALREVQLERLDELTERRIAERTLELEDRIARYRSLLEGTAAVPFEYDAIARRVRYVGPQAMRMLGCTAEQLADKDFLAGLIHPDDRARVAQELDDLVRGQRAAEPTIDCRVITPERRVMYTRTYLGEAGGPGAARATARRHVRGISIDITRQRMHEADRQQSQKLESVGRLAAGVAHEINTPIQFVGDSVEFVRGAMTDVAAVLERQRAIVQDVLAGRPALEAARSADALFHSAEVPFLFDELPRTLERACDGIERVARIVRSMRSFAHPDGIEMVDVDLNRAIEATLTIARNEYRYVADMATDYGELPPVRCHAGEINQVILNIVINAAHAIAERVGETGGRGLITVKTRRAESGVEIAITDNGPGIPEDVAQRIFDPFFTTKSLDRGTGQGLAIARTVVVEKHHGSLTFDTVVGGGTTFYIRIPVSQAPARDLEAA